MLIKTVGDLDVAYSISGVDGAATVLLLHGWPDDASTWDRLVKCLTDAGFRTVVPSLRGFGDTRFRSKSASRTGDPAILAMDAIGLMDALAIDRFAVVGHDWGSSIAEALAVGWPERISRMALLSTSPRLGGLSTPSFEQSKLDWYHWFMATSRGAEAVRKDPTGFAHRHWVDWGPPGWFEENTFAQVSQAWTNPDWLDVTLHSYRSRWDESPPDPRSVWLDAKVKATGSLSLPVLIFQGAADGVTAPNALNDVHRKFSGSFQLVTLEGVGHFPQREAPDEVLTMLLPFLSVSETS
ncbi:alpha/beta fold hydrolase [Paraburkholderia strydomiana]|uniref:alpha/beta fold hydrolase n=1 Tax=Paraburkholderia strydomiana TaxID=1245417 RepID=UPI001BE673BA|nr:alpha/beta hydrolase [Paraburkholderia strydomiana]MBT2794825.1 alpha/beta hydrolase [Paraburkholderia strydomiana]